MYWFPDLTHMFSKFVFFVLPFWVFTLSSASPDDGGGDLSLSLGSSAATKLVQNAMIGALRSPRFIELNVASQQNARYSIAHIYSLNKVAVGWFTYLVSLFSNFTVFCLLRCVECSLLGRSDQRGSAECDAEFKLADQYDCAAHFSGRQTDQTQCFGLKLWILFLVLLW